MNIFSFTAHFGSEEECKFHFKSEQSKRTGSSGKTKYVNNGRKYTLNRRYFEEKLFDRLIVASITGLGK